MNIKSGHNLMTAKNDFIALMNKSLKGNVWGHCFIFFSIVISLKENVSIIILNQTTIIYDETFHLFIM